MQIQGENAAAKRKKASSTTRGIKSEIKQLNQLASNAYQNYLDEVQE